MTELTCEVHQLGLVPYEVGWKMQDNYAGEISQGIRPATLLLLEHPPTFTFGRRGVQEHLLWDEDELNRRGIHTYWIDRGGDVTYHGPGQLVGYPLLPILPGGLQAKGKAGHHPKADLIGYIRKLEQVLILALDSLGVKAKTKPGLTGVWIDRLNGQTTAKIAAIGIKVDAKGVSRHGFALNVNPDMSHWDGIVACGLANKLVTSLAELVSPCPSMTLVRAMIIEAFRKTMGYQLEFV